MVVRVKAVKSAACDNDFVVGAGGAVIAPSAIDIFMKRAVVDDDGVVVGFTVVAYSAVNGVCYCTCIVSIKSNVVVGNFGAVISSSAEDVANVACAAVDVDGIIRDRSTTAAAISTSPTGEEIGSDAPAAVDIDGVAVEFVGRAGIRGTVAAGRDRTIPIPIDVAGSDGNTYIYGRCRRHTRRQEQGRGQPQGNEKPEGAARARRVLRCRPTYACLRKLLCQFWKSQGNLWGFA